MGNPFVHLDLATDDIAAAKAFYGAVFGFRPADDLPPLAIEFADRLGR